MNAHFQTGTSLYAGLPEDNFIPLTTLRNIAAVEGGVPILHDGKVIGAIGVTPEQDGIIAAVGIAAFQ